MNKATDITYLDGGMNPVPTAKTKYRVWKNPISLDDGNSIIIEIYNYLITEKSWYPIFMHLKLGNKYI